MAAEAKYQYRVTLAELCQAIAEGRLPYTVSDGHYEVRAADVRRLRRPGRGRLALPSATDIPTELLDCPEMGQLDCSA